MSGQLLQLCCCDGGQSPDECPNIEADCPSSAIGALQATGTTVLQSVSFGTITISWQWSFVAIMLAQTSNFGQPGEVNRYIASGTTGTILNFLLTVISESSSGSQWGGNGSFTADDFGNVEMIVSCRDDSPPVFDPREFDWRASCSGSNLNTMQTRYLGPGPPQACPAPAAAAILNPDFPFNGLRSGSVSEVSATIDSFAFNLT